MFKWKHSKHSKYSKILVTIVYSDQIETEKHFLKTSQQSRIYGKNFRSIVSLLQKTVSTSLLKNLQKTEKCSFQTRRTFAFELKVVSKPFSKKRPMTKFWFKYFWTLCIIFPENGFNFITQKFAKKLKNTLFKR